MHVYLVRHGETELNAKHIHQSPNTPLSVRGIQQIETTAEYVREVNPDFLISSEYTRALESAQIIGRHVGLAPQVSDVLYEIERPSQLFGKTIFNFETLWYILLLIVHRADRDWHYTDGENFIDIENRAKKALTYLESLHDTHRSVIVVSHTVFINMMVSALCKKQRFTLWDLVCCFYNILCMKNGEVIHLEYVRHTSANACHWRLIRDI